MGGRCCKCSSFCCRRDLAGLSENDDLTTQKRLLGNIPLYSVNIDNPEKCRLAICRLSDFRYKEKIGYGRFGVVYRVLERRTSRSLAMKEVPKKQDIYRNEPRLEREHVIMSKLKSPWLVEMYQCYETYNKRLMLLQFLPGPTFAQLTRNKTIPPFTIKIYAAQMLMAVLAVHSHGYIHRDIKMANFLLDIYGNVKLCDFGSCIRFLPVNIARKVFPSNEDYAQAPTEDVVDARQVLIEELQYRPCIPHGTSHYCAPEVICQATWAPFRDTYTYMCDYWSLGVCLYYLMYRKLPFYSGYRVQVPSLIMHWQKTLKFPKSKTVPQEAVDLLRGLLRDDTDRLGKMGVHEISTHPYFKGFQWSDMGEVESNNDWDLEAHLAVVKTETSSKICDESPMIKSLMSLSLTNPSPGRNSPDEVSQSVHFNDTIVKKREPNPAQPFPVTCALAVLNDHRRMNRSPKSRSDSQTIPSIRVIPENGVPGNDSAC
ncbi:serine/threonine-protein kinase 38-like [Littorina saxatilis]|uniref:Serine/threonine-protein kinase greatwall n=1 Tax=Littorina saxatilis TaxID=31220 RepID=A0AAN9G6Y8_9CAEN